MAKEITLSGDVGFEITAEELEFELKQANGADVILLVNSRGGFVFEGIEIFNLIRAYKGHVEARIVGLAASAASYLILAADKVTAFDNAAFFIHNAINIVFGNHNDMRKMADELEGLSNLLAKAYINKSGKSGKEIKALMDEETIFFADEILEAGFIDEIIESEDLDDSTDRASATITARASMDACINRMRKSEAANDDFQKAVAYIEGISALMEPTQKSKPVAVAVDDNNIETPAVAGTTTQEEKFMTMAEFLAANPGAKAEYDASIAQARVEGATAAKDEMKAIVAKVKPILTSAAYDDKIKDFGAQVIVGEKTLDGFEAIVFMKDQEIAKAEADAAAAETDETEETPGAAASDDVDAQASFAAKKERVKAGV